MMKHVVNAGTLLTLLAACACGSVPYLTYVGDDAGGVTNPSSDPPDATTAVADAGTTAPPDTGSSITPPDAGAPIGDAGSTKDAGCGGGPIPAGYVCCSDIVCKSDSCSSDTCRQCPTTCPLPMVCCEQRRGGFGGEVRCSPYTDCK